MTAKQYDYLLIMISESLNCTDKVGKDLKEKDYALADIQQRLGQIVTNQSKLYHELQLIKEMVVKD